jgi:hypothetical protein
MDNLTSEEADQLLSLTLIAITALFAVLSAIGLWLGRKAVALLKVHVGVATAERVGAFVDSAITSGISLAEVQAKKFARGAIKEGPRTGPEKMEAAKTAARSLAPAALSDVGDEKLELLIEAKLQSMQPWMVPTPGSLPPPTFSLPPPAPLPDIKTPIPPKRRT